MFHSDLLVLAPSRLIHKKPNAEVPKLFPLWPTSSLTLGSQKVKQRGATAVSLQPIFSKVIIQLLLLGLFLDYFMLFWNRYQKVNCHLRRARSVDMLPRKYVTKRQAQEGQQMQVEPICWKKSHQQMQQPAVRSVLDQVCKRSSWITTNESASA